ncbi:MAG: hypothetical protein IPK82_15255 [Polyangiaceae bacterium]|nr:hypothetical protein [Polyangiaceae bacterium]
MMRFMKLRHLTPAAGLVLLSSCSSTPPSLPITVKVDPTAGTKLASPARYFLTEGFGAAFDEGAPAAPVPKPEYAIAAGRRIQLDGGAIIGEGRSPAGLVGFRSLPADMGGGYLVWSDLRSYYTKDFLGDLTPIADIAPTAGTRRWFSSILFRTPRGILSLDPKTRALSRWRGSPGVVDMLAMDDKRGVTIDLTGRVRVTFDAGTTWTDFTASKGFLSNSARLGKKGEIELLSLLGAAEYRMMPGASAVEPIPPVSPFNRRYSGYGSSPYQYVLNPTMAEEKPIEGFSRRLASESFGWAVAVGVGLPGERALVGAGYGGENNLSMVSVKTGVELQSIAVLGVGSPYSNCQPFRTPSDLLLVCAHTEGANVLLIKDNVATPKLEATFPDVASFFGDDQGHIAYAGRCGRTPPSIDDFGAMRSPDQPYMGEDYGYAPYPPYGYDQDYEEPVGTSDAERAKPASDEKHICVRLDGGQWIEHRLSGDDAKDLYRWVLGKDGAVTALLVEGANPESKESTDEPPPEEPGDEEGDESLRRKRSEARSTRPTGLLAAPTSQPSAPPKPPKAGASAQPKAAPKPPKSAPPKPAASGAPSAKPSADPKAVTVEKPRKLLRAVRIDPKDRGARHGKWIQVLTPLDQAPWRSVDSNFWTEDDGAVRGWIRLPEETQGGHSHEEEPAGDMSGDGSESPISTEYSGRFAGVRISAEGKVTTFSLPAHTKNVIFGSRFAMARAENDSGDLVTYHETTDGGATWTEVEGPPVGDIDEQYDGSRAPSCSALGCALNYGVVRLGWTSPKPAGKKRDRESTDSGLDLFPMPRLPKLECKFEGEPETFPLPAPKPKAAPKPPPSSNADRLEEMERRIREVLAGSGETIPPDMFPPGMIPTGLPIAPPPPSGSPKAPVKPGKPIAPPKPPPPPRAEIVSIRTKPQSALGQIQDKNWAVDFLVPFDPQASVKRASTAANGLERLQGSVTPVVGFSGAELLLTFDKRRTTVGGAGPNILQFEYNGRFVSAASLALSGSGNGKGAPVNIAALDEERRVLVLFTGDAARPVLRMAKIPDPARGRLSVARRVDGPGAALIWYSTTTGEVLAAPIDFGKAEVGAFASLASLSTMADGGLPACSAKTPVKGPVFQLIMELGIPVSVSAQSGKSLYNGGDVSSSLLVTAHSERICVSAIEVRGSGNSLDLTASLGPKAAAVSRSKTSAEDPTQLAVQKLSCLLKEPESR